MRIVGIPRLGDMVERWVGMWCYELHGVIMADMSRVEGNDANSDDHPLEKRMALELLSNTLINDRIGDMDIEIEVEDGDGEGSIMRDVIAGLLWVYKCIGAVNIRTWRIQSVITYKDGYKLGGFSAIVTDVNDDREYRLDAVTRTLDGRPIFEYYEFYDWYEDRPRVHALYREYYISAIYDLTSREIMGDIDRWLGNRISIQEYVRVNTI